MDGICLNPRFDGAFLNSMLVTMMVTLMGLNPRFDGAFLNSRNASRKLSVWVLIPDLMGLF